MKSTVLWGQWHIAALGMWPFAALLLGAQTVCGCGPHEAARTPAPCVVATSAATSAPVVQREGDERKVAEPVVVTQGAAPALRVVPQVGHVGKIEQVSYSLDGRFLITQSDEIKLWDPPTGLMLGTLQIPGDRLLGFGLHPDNQRLVAGSFEGTVSIWQIEEAQRVATWRVPGADFCAKLDVSADGAQVLAGCRGAVAIFDTVSGRLITRLDTTGNQVQAVAFTPDGPVVVLERRGKLEVWDVQRGKIRFVTKTIADPQKVVFSSDGARMVVGLGGSEAGGYALAKQQQHEVHIYESSRGNLLQVLKGLKREISGAELSTDGKRLAAVSYHTLSIFELTSGAIEKTVPIYPRSPNVVAFHPDGSEVSVGGAPMNSTPPSLVTYDARSLNPKQTFEGTRWLPAAAAFNGDGTRALIGSQDEEVTLWDTETGAVLSNNAGRDDWNLMDVGLADDGQHAVVGSTTKAVFWDFANLTQRSARLGTLWTYQVGITPDARRAIGCGYGSIMKVWDYATSRPISTVRVGNDNSALLHGCALSPDGKRAVYVFEGDRARLVDADTGNQIHEYDAFGGITRLHISRDGNLMLSIGERLGLWRLEERKPLRTLAEKGHGVVDAALTPDNALLVSVDGSSVVTVRDVRTSAVQRELRAVTGQFKRIAVAGDGRRLIAASRDGTARLFDLASGRSIALVASGKEWLMFDDDGHFDASQRGGELVAVVHKGRPFRIDQLAMRFNDPGRMLAGMGLGQGGVHEHFTAWYKRRLRRLNVNESRVETAFSGAPEAAITGLEAAPDGLSANVAFELKATSAGLNGYQVYVNDVPLFGPTGHTLTIPSGGSFRGEERVPLTPGVNRVEVAALGSDGIQSFRVLRKVESATTQPRDLYVLAFGVSKYRNPAYNLGFAHKDALDLVDVTKTMGGVKNGFRAVHAQAFVDEQVTVPVLRAAKQLLLPARPNDVVLVFVAGHGMYSRDADAKYYYLTHEAEPNRLADTAAPFELIEDLVQGIQPRQKLLLIDTCTSGERDDDDEVSAKSAPGARSRSIRGLVLASAGAPKARPRSYLLDRNRFIYNDLLRRSGAIVFSSSRGTELSFEDDSIQNGYFTEHILRAFTSGAADRNRDGSVSPTELHAFVQRSVSSATSGVQNPTVDHNNVVVDFGFPVALNAASIADRSLQALPPAASRERPRGLVFNVEASASVSASASASTPCVPVTATPHACGCRVTGGGEQRGAAAGGLGLAILILGGGARRRQKRAVRPPSRARS